MATDSAATVESFIRGRLRCGPAPGVPEIRLYRATPTSGLSHFLGPSARPPYWAYDWAGGTVLARCILNRPNLVRNLRVLDLGTGSGIVAIAAAIAGAASVVGVDIDPASGVAAALNAAENGVSIAVRTGEGLQGGLPDADIVTAGDLFYEAALARRASRFLFRCRAAGIAVLIGDPGRRYLPAHRLHRLAEATVPDFDRPGGVAAAVYDVEAPRHGGSGGLRPVRRF